MKIVITLCLSLLLSTSIFSQEPHSVNSAGGTEEIEGNIQSSWTLGSLVVGKTENSNLSLHNGFVPLVAIHDNSINTSIEDLLILTELKTYPVPAEDLLQLSFDWEKYDSFQMEVYNLSGQKIMSMKQDIVMGRNELQLNVSDWPAGQYLIHLFNADGEVAAAKVQVH